MARLGVLVSGNGSNLQALIDASRAGTISGQIAVVISNRKDAFALRRAEQAGIESLCITHGAFSSREEFDAKVVEELRSRDVDWVVFAGFMRLVTPVLLDAYRHRIVNLHPSLLPAFPGVDAAKQALEYGVKLTGCTVHIVTPEMDSGPIIAQAAVPVLDSDDEQTLLERIHAVEHETLVGAVAALCDGRVQVNDATPPARAKVFVRAR